MNRKEFDESVLEFIRMYIKGAKSNLKDPNQMMIDLHKAVDDAFNQAESEGTK